METRLVSEINTLLKEFPEYWSEELLIKHKVIDDLREYRIELIEALLSNETVFNAYGIKTSRGVIIKIEDLISMLRYKKYWDDSYTKYSTQIGLANDGKYLNYSSDVILDFPYKDCVLEGGMTSENLGKKEVYYHKVLAKEEIDLLFSEKILTNVKKFSKGDLEEIENFNDNDNLIIKGNNLIGLHILKKRYARKVKLIYIDPPYNTGGDSFKYNDRFNHSTWLTFMKNRLEVTKDLLEDGGSIWVNIDDTEAHYLKVLMDEIFHEGFVANIIWQKRTSPDARATLGDAHDHILVYTNNVSKFKENLKPLPLTDEQIKRFKNPDDDPRGPWVSSDFTAQGFRPNQMYKIITPSGKEYSPPPGRCWKNIQSEHEKIRAEGRMWFGKNGDAMPRRKTYLKESAGRVIWTWWPNNEVGHNQEAKKESIALFGENMPFSTPKPERLIHRIIHLCTNENDRVLDFFAGSGTTLAVAHKMNRKYIGIEQITYETDYLPERLKKVISGDQVGISKEVDWHGGGSFVYAELFELNQHFFHQLMATENDTSLLTLLSKIQGLAHFDYKVNLGQILKDEDFKNLSLEEKKRVIVESLDANLMYLGYSEIDDKQYEIPDNVKAFNHSFYSATTKVGEGE